MIKWLFFSFTTGMLLAGKAHSQELPGTACQAAALVNSSFLSFKSSDYNYEKGLANVAIHDLKEEVYEMWFKTIVPSQGNFNFKVEGLDKISYSLETFTGSCNNLIPGSNQKSIAAEKQKQQFEISRVKPGSMIYLRLSSNQNFFNWNFQAGAFLPPPPNNQDCPDAIPICQDIYSTVLSYSGTGNIPNEINPLNSCLANGERNDVWYTFTVQTSGNLSFTIAPNDSLDDYDWAVYDLTTHNCAAIFNTPSIMKSCNYSLTPGLTGPNGIGSTNSQGAIGDPFNLTIPVLAGQTYVINISNFSASNNGYTLDFTASSAQIYDNTPPQLQNLVTPISCGSSSITMNFSENILCSSVQNGDFTLTGPGGPYTITGWSSVSCATGASYDNTISVTFNPAISMSGNFDFCLVNTSGSVTDLCGNVALPACISFSVSGITTNIAGTDVICFGGSGGSATVNAAGGSGNYTYIWSPSGGNAANASGLVAGTYTVTVTDGSSCSSTASFVVNQPPALTAVISGFTDVLCNNANNGTATVSVNGGTPPYLYLWSNGNTGASLSGLNSGNFIITATDAHGCTTTTSVDISEPAPLSVVPAGTNVTCYNGSNGNVSVVANGGTIPYTYVWSDGNTNALNTNILAGTYTATITDTHGCTATALQVINQPTDLILMPAFTDVSCNGLNNGTVSVAVNGGTAAYNYTWSNGNTSTAQNALAANSYTITVTDAAGCTKSAMLNISEPPALVLNTNVSGATCGSNNGSASVYANGGNPGYLYLWSNGATTSAINSLAAGPYDVTVTDASGCSVVVTLNISNTSGPNAMIASFADVSCNGGSDGSASLNVNGGLLPYSYTWSNGATTAAVNALNSGNYSVTVTDANGCISAASVIIDEPSPINLNLISADVLCNSENTGNGSVAANGGVPPYSFLWSNGNTNGAINNLTAGNYTITVTDSHACMSTGTVTIAEPTQLVLLPSYTDVNCFGGSDGSISAPVNGGTLPYNYAWSNGSTSTTISNLLTGTYSLTVTDGNGCTVSVTSVINEPAALVLNTSSSPAACGSSNGSASVIANGGSPAYSYAWSNGITTASNNPLASGPYDVTVTDSKGCTTMTTLNVGSTSGPVANIAASSDASCNGGSDGSATVNANGGLLPYSYLWSNGATTASISSLPAGNYAVTITDANGCVSSASIVLNEPSALLLNPAFTSVLCNGTITGDANVTVNGGISPYSYLWSNGNANAGITAIAAGNYTVTVTDNHGCTSTNVISITEPASLSWSLSATDASCNGGSDGSVSVHFNGGTNPYTYLWNTGDTSNAISGLAASTYTVTVTDANGCTVSVTSVINEPAPITIVKNTVSASCGSSNGTASAIPNGGTGPFTFLWSNGVTTSTNVNIPSGNYQVTVTDALGCTATKNVNVPNSSGPVISIAASTDVSCNGGSNGSVTAGVSGLMPLTYLWSNGETTLAVNSISAGTYTVTVTDANGCSSSASQVISEPPSLIINPSSNDVLCYGGNSGNASVIVNGGSIPYSYLWSNGDTNNTIINLISGNYTVSVSDGNGCSLAIGINISEPSLLSLTTVVMDASCYGGSNGNASVNAIGGSGAYSYQWSSGETTDSILNHNAGTYTITVTDGQGCVVLSTAQISEPASITIGKTTVAATCGNANGSAHAIPGGGTGPYSFLWSNGALTGTIQNIPAGNYQVTVTDAMGCTGTRNINIPNASGPVISLNLITDVTCKDGNDGTIGISVNGGLLPYTFAWSTGGTTAAITNIPSGIYTVTVTDANSCTTEFDTLISEPPVLTLITNVTDVLCNGNSTGASSVIVNGGTMPYSYVWSNAVTLDIIQNIAAGVYTVTVSDNHNCTASAPVNIVETAQLVLQPSSSDVKCHGGNDGTISVVAGGGTGPYSYVWSTGNTNDHDNNLVAGTYTVIVIDSNACTTSVSPQITEPAALAINMNSSASSCIAPTGSATAIVSGGSGPYSFSWSNGSSLGNNTTLSAGTYTVTVIDAAGCSAINSIQVFTTSGPVVNVLTTDVNCFGMMNGSATLNIAGNAPPFSCLWSTNSSANGITNLDTGNYAVTVTDFNGCSVISTFIINQPALLAGTIHSSDVQCYSENTGYAWAAGSGGIIPYAYQWTNGSIADSALNLQAGTYTVTITDGNGCTFTKDILIHEPGLLTGISSATDAVCNGLSNGTIHIAAGSGTMPYTYQWSNGATLANVTGLSAGTYTITVTDSHGCSLTSTSVISQPSSLAVNYQTVSSTCGLPNGSATIMGNGGTPGYSFLWSNGTTSPVISGVLHASYTVTVTDSHGCSLVQNIQIADLAGPAAVISTLQDVSCYGFADGFATVSVNSGAAPFSYIWSTGATIATGNNLTAGNYSVTITDQNNCASHITVSIGQPAFLVPSVNHTDALCYGTATGTAQALAAGGTAPYSYQWSNAATLDVIDSLAASSYTVTVTDSHGCIATASEIINEPALLVLSTSSTAALCYGASSGTAIVNVAGGTVPYYYNWSSGSTLFSASGLTAGNYTVNISDGNGCTSAATVTVGQAPVLTIQTSVTPVLCFGGNTGSLMVTATGGTGNYSYQWSSGSAAGSLNSNLFAGTYTVTVTDVNNCTLSSSAIVTSPAKIILNAVLTDVTCYGNNDGIATIIPAGGVPPFSYAWSNGVTSGNSISNLGPGNYGIVVTDQHACTCFATVTIHEPPPLLLSASGSTTICIGQQTLVSAAATGGTGGYFFSWSNGSTLQNQMVSPPATTTYTVNVTDANNCTTTKKTVAITVYPPLTVVASNNEKICDGESIAISAQASGGNGGPYTFLWNNNAGNSSTVVVTPHATTTYMVTASDNCGTPVAQTSVTIIVNPLPIVKFEILPDEGCVPLTVIFKNLSVTSLKAYYLWGFGDGQTDTLKNPVHAYLQEGIYDVSLRVSSDEGCISTMIKKQAVKVNGLPQAGFTADPTVTSILHPLISFTDHSAGASFWDWDFGDGLGSSLLQNPQYLYRDTGAYQVRLIVENIHLCSDTIYEVVVIGQDFTLYIPNAFTPNQDGTNEVFLMQGIGVDAVELFIYDRWGKRVFYSGNIHEGWNGRVNNSGEECQQDTYVYLVKVTNFNGEKKEITGRVSLIR